MWLFVRFVILQGVLLLICLNARSPCVCNMPTRLERVKDEAIFYVGDSFQLLVWRKIVEIRIDLFFAVDNQRHIIYYFGATIITGVYIAYVRRMSPAG